MVSKIANYTNASEIQRWWLESIAPNYFDFEDVNLYRCGIFGYINEICSTVTEDGWNGISIARREFYPALAQYKQSLYKMATVQDIPLPMVVPAAVDCILIIPEKDIIEKGTQSGDNITYILDDTLTAPIGNYTFMLDYPVIILARESGGEYSYTTHYDKTYSNSISTVQNKYVYHKRIRKNGEYLLLIKVRMSQVELTPDEATVSRTSIIDTYTVDFNFSGDLANFEVFYKENDNSRVVQLKKQIDGSPAVNEPFCNYKFLSDNTLRLIFPFNTKFIPAYNSYISIRIYTSSGSKATFKVYKDDFSCTTNSEKYPYNNETIILGVVEGSTINGYDKPDIESFRQKIINAFSTNQTIISKNDLQILFNERNDNDKNHISFEQSRDDAFARIYGAYMLLKDSNSMVVPTNTLDLLIDNNSTFDVSYPAANRYIIKPGKLFGYQDSEIKQDIPLEDINTTVFDVYMNISDNLDIYEYGDNERFYFTNPFLISVTTNPNAVGYYLNSIYKSMAIDFSYVNDGSIAQFIATNLSMKRNAILGEDSYTLTLIVSPSTDNVDVNDLYGDSGLTEIRATKSGMIQSITFDNEKNALFANVLYDGEYSTKAIQCGSTLKPGSGYKPQTGYKLHYGIYERFEAGNIIATPHVLDLQKIKIFLQLNTSDDAGDIIVPFVLEEINENGNLIFRAYIPTDDFISLDNTTRIIGNVFDNASDNPKAITSPIGGIKPYICFFYNNDGNNIINSYSTWPYVKGLTLTNIYELTNDETLDFIYPINFMNSVLLFEETPSDYYLGTDELMGGTGTGYLRSLPNGTHDSLKNGCITKRTQCRNLYPGEYGGTLDGFITESPDENNVYFCQNPEIFFNNVLPKLASEDYMNSEIVNFMVGAQLHVGYFLHHIICTDLPALSTKEFYNDKNCGITTTYIDSNGNIAPGLSIRVPESLGIRSTDELITYIIDNQLSICYELNESDYVEITDIENEFNIIPPDYSVEGKTVIKDLEIDDESITANGFYSINLYGMNAFWVPSLMRIRQIPLVKANWIKSESNSSYLIDNIYDNYYFVKNIFYRLEESFSIDLKFFNSYGKSRNYYVGIKNSSSVLDKVNCSLSFGIKLSVTTDEANFKNEFTTFVRSYIESLNATSADNSLYILNMLSDARSQFNEIEYIEYYGMNNYGTDVQKIESIPKADLLAAGIKNQVPEFININSIIEDGVKKPKIDILFL